MVKAISVHCVGLNDKHLIIVRSLLRLLDGRNGVQWSFADENCINTPHQILITNNQDLFSDMVQNHRSEIATKDHIFVGRDTIPLVDKKVHHLTDSFRPAELLVLLNSIEKEKVASFLTQSVDTDKNIIRYQTRKEVSISELSRIMVEIPASKKINIFLQERWIGAVGTEGSIKASHDFMAENYVFESGQSLYCQLTDSHTEPEGIPLHSVIDTSKENFAWRLARIYCQTPESLGLSPETIIHLKQWPDFGYFRELGRQKGVFAITSRLSRAPGSLQQFMQKSNMDTSLFFQLLGLCALLGYINYATEEGSEPRLETGVEREKTEPAIMPFVFDFVRRVRSKFSLF